MYDEGGDGTAQGMSGRWFPIVVSRRRTWYPSVCTVIVKPLIIIILVFIKPPDVATIVEEEDLVFVSFWLQLSSLSLLRIVKPPSFSSWLRDEICHLLFCIPIINGLMMMIVIFCALQDYRDSEEPGCQYLQEFVYENNDRRTSTKTK